MAFCAKCGSSLNEGASFCPACGTAVGSAAAPPPPPPYANTPPYTPYQDTPYLGPAAGAPPPPPYPGQPYAGQPYAGQQYPGQPYMAPPAASGLQQNVAGLLCYALGWLTGIIFLLIDKRPFVRFHAAQSIVVFGALFLLRIVLTFAFAATYVSSGLWGLHVMISGVLSLVTLAAWIILMTMAYQGKEFEVPIAAGIARNIAGKVQP